MSDTYEQLRKVLDLEKSKGYQNTAVFGGLDKFLERQSDKFKDDLPSPSYAELSLSEREKWVEKALLGSHVDMSKHSRKTQTQPQVDSAVFNESITAIKGISSRMLTKFGKLGVQTIKDMLYYFPRRHIDYSKTKHIADLEIGQEQTVIGTIWQAALKGIGRFGRKATEAIIGDASGNIRIVWFNQPYLAKKMRTNERIAISGRVSTYMGQKVFESPEYEILTSDDLVHTGRLVPVYPLTEGLAARTVRRLVKEAVDLWAQRIPEFLPRSVRDHAHLMLLNNAIEQAHYPDSEHTKNESRKRLAFDELFLIQLGVLSRKRDWQEQQDVCVFSKRLDCVDKFVSSLPYELTGAQRKALDEMIADVGKTRPMSRLIQGDVGSGKTVVAAAAMILAAANGCQAAFMAPTEILAEQHYRTMAKLFGVDDVDSNTFELSSDTFGFPISVCLLMGSTKKKDKQQIYDHISDGSIDIVIGTHALIQESVAFKELGFAVADEQHRFGVLQRSSLRQKGASPHVLVMSATPIPRTLALTLYGDLDISVIDEMPPGRQEIMTRLGGPENRGKAYQFIRDKIKAEQQAFIICPLVEESEAIDAKAAVTEHERLARDIFPQFDIGLLHGRMSSAEKEADDFQAEAFPAEDEDATIFIKDAGEDEKANIAGTLPSPTAFLTVVQSQHLGPDERYDISGTILIGRSPGCEISVPDKSVSRKHAEIYLDGARYYIRDIGSKYGTKVNDRSISTSRVDLTDGAQIELGPQTVFKFHLQEREDELDDRTKKYDLKDDGQTLITDS